MHASVTRDLAAMLGEGAVSRAETDRLAYCRDMWPRNLILLRSGVDRIYAPDVVVWPANPGQVAAVAAYASRRSIPLIPFGGGSGVCGGTVPRRGGILMDIKRLDRVDAVDPISQTVKMQTGARRQIFEDTLNSRGYSAGHFPASIACSTVGGWIAARGAGQMSSLYGKIEDMVSRVRFVTSEGEIRQAHGFPHRSPGPGWLQAIIGCEGTLAIVTDCTMRVHRLPERRVFRSVMFPSLEHGVACMRDMMAVGLRPAVLRLYDPLDTLLARLSHGSGSSAPAIPALSKLLKAGVDRSMTLALVSPGITNTIVEKLSKSLGSGVSMILIFEGTGALPESELSLALSMMLAHRGKDMGAEPARSWLKRRYAISFWQSKVFSGGGFSDTFEVSTTWDRIMPLYREVVDVIGRRALVMAHLSHAYLQGCSIYFSFAGRGSDDEAMLRTYDAIWEEGLRAVQRAEGTISHHHGIGMSKSSAMSAELGGALEVFEALRSALDPRLVMNPGKLTPD
jgi:alkyldihydroxyacetonephosphate synthase